MKKLFSYTLQYNGLNFTGLVNYLIKNDISIYDINKEDVRNITFKISYMNYKKLKKINKLYNFSIIKNGGVKSILKIGLKRLGIAVGCIAIFASNILLHNSSILVEVVGDTLYSEKIIESVKNYCSQLEEKNNFDNLKIEKYLLDNIEELSLVSVKKQGDIILINAMDKKQVVEEFEPLCAPYNMLINDIELISGTLLVGKNDVIKKGDVIVDSYTISSKGDRIVVPAKAHIKADVWFCGSETVMKENIIYKKTGNKKEYSNLYFKDIINTDIMSPYLHYMSETTIINVNNNHFVPIFLVKNVFYETEKIVCNFDFENEKENCLEKSKQKAYTNLPKNVTIQEIKQNISNLSDRYIFQTYLKTTLEIGNEN